MASFDYRKTPVIHDAAGDPIRLSNMEQSRCNRLQKMANDLGYEINITTLTTIVKKISEQKFFEIYPADYLPVRVGEGTWSSNLVTYRSYELSDVFETGIINLGGQSSRLASADMGVDSLSIQIINWAKTIQWTIFELEEASRAGNFDLIAAKEKSRKKNYDLGIQRVAFLGARGLNASNGVSLGLLNQVGITTNTTVITAPISTLSTAALKTFCAQVVEAYRNNCNRTAFPTL